MQATERVAGGRRKRRVGEAGQQRQEGLGRSRGTLAGRDSEIPNIQ